MSVVATVLVAVYAIVLAVVAVAALRSWTYADLRRHLGYWNCTARLGGLRAMLGV